MPENLPGPNLEEFAHLQEGINEMEKLAIKPKIKEFKIEDTTVRFIGVIHIGDTFEANRELFESEINKANLVVCEGLPEVMGYSYAAAWQMAHEAGISKPDFDRYYGSDGMSFFTKIGRLTHQLNKPVAIVDPNFDFSLKRQTIESQVNQNEINAMKRETVMFGGGVGFLVIDGIIQNAIQRRVARESNTDQPRNLSRREFLKLGAKTMAVLATTPILSRLIEAVATSEDPRIDDVSKLPRHTFLDYRNVVIAEGLKRVAHENPGKNIAMIYGANHAHDVEFYVNHDVPRSLKFSMYRDLEAILKPALRMYKPTPDHWQKISEVPITGIR